MLFTTHTNGKSQVQENSLLLAGSAGAAHTLSPAATPTPLTPCPPPTGSTSGPCCRGRRKPSERAAGPSQNARRPLAGSSCPAASRAPPTAGAALRPSAPPTGAPCSGRTKGLSPQPRPAGGKVLDFKSEERQRGLLWSGELTKTWGWPQPKSKS